MKKEVRKEYEELSKKIGVEITENTIKEGVSIALAKLVGLGLPKEALKKMLETARPMGDFGWFEKRMSFEDFNEFFSGPVRKYGLDGSISHPFGCFGASTVPEILNISPYKSNIDTYERMRGKKEQPDIDKETIFYAGHKIEPVYRDYFRYMYGERYIVLDCDIQWASRKYPHFIGNCDGLLVDKHTGQVGVLEVKHTTMNNVKTINAVKDGDPPKYWDAQERCYMELMNLDFACLFLGWGNRPGLDTNAMHRIERDPILGESFLEQAETFMVDNVEAGVKPSFKNIRNYERMVNSIENLYGAVDRNKKPVKLGKEIEPAIKALLEAEDEIQKAKLEEAAAKKKVKEAQKEYENLQLPIIEILKNAPKGTYIDADNVHYDITYDVRDALDVNKVCTLYPDVYEKVNKPAVDTALLKKIRPDVYSDCFGPNLNSDRKFSMRVWKAKA